MTADEKARWDSVLKRADQIIHKLSAEAGDSPFLEDMKALQGDLCAIPDKQDQDEDVRRLGKQLGSAVSGLVGENATVNVYVTVNGK